MVLSSHKRSLHLVSKGHRIYGKNSTANVGNQEQSHFLYGYSLFFPADVISLLTHAKKFPVLLSVF